MRAVVPDGGGKLGGMDNMYQPAGDPQDLDQTQQLPPMGGTAGPGDPGFPAGAGGPDGPDGPGGHGFPGGPGAHGSPGAPGAHGFPGGPGGHGFPGGPGFSGGSGFPGNGGSVPAAPRHRRALRWGAGAALATLLFGGGVVASGLTGSSSPVLSSNAASAGAAAPTGQAAQLNAILSSATSPGAASAAAAFGSASPGTARTARAVRCRRVRARLRATGHLRAAHAVARACHRIGRVRLLGGMYGQFTFRTRSGVRTIAYERGAVQSDSGNSVVVRAADGTTETWNLTSKTVVRQNHGKTTSSALSAGQQAFVAGPVVSGAHDIRLAVIRPVTAGSASGNPASGS